MGFLLSASALADDIDPTVRNLTFIGVLRLSPGSDAGKVDASIEWLAIRHARPDCPVLAA
jgi:hypothetical protein